MNSNTHLRIREHRYGGWVVEERKNKTSTDKLIDLILSLIVTGFTLFGLYRLDLVINDIISRL